eukprot:CFRG6369T1
MHSLPPYRKKPDIYMCSESLLDDGVLPDYSDVEFSMYGPNGELGDSDDEDCELSFRNNIKYYSYSEYQFNSGRRRLVDNGVLWVGIVGFGLTVALLLCRDWYVYTKDDSVKESVGLMSMALNRYLEANDTTLLFALFFSWLGGITSSIVVVLNNLRMSGIDSESSRKMLKMHIIGICLAAVTEFFLVVAFILFVNYNNLPLYYERDEKSVYLLVLSVLWNAVLIIVMILSLLSISCTLHLPTASPRYGYGRE